MEMMTMAEALLWEHMTVKEVREALENTTQTILIPLGVTEQHGYHLPLRMDCYNCEEISIRASEQCGCFVAPTLAYTYSGGELPGTINISPHVVTQMVVEILHSLCLQGLRNLIVVLGHGGSAVKKLLRKCRCPRALMPVQVSMLAAVAIRRSRCTGSP